MACFGVRISSPESVLRGHMREENVVQLNLRDARPGDQTPGPDFHERGVHQDQIGNVRLVHDISPSGADESGWCPG